MVTDGRYRAVFKSIPISEFRAQLGLEDLSILNYKDKPLLLALGTTYLCETTAFSRYTATKTEYKARSGAEDDMRLQLTSGH